VIQSLPVDRKFRVEQHPVSSRFWRLLRLGLIVPARRALLAFAAARKLSHRPQAVASKARVGVREENAITSRVILLAGGAGLVLGAAWQPIGVAARALLLRVG
jgi:hypothetical protein